MPSKNRRASFMRSGSASHPDLTDEQVAEYKNVFEMFDTDGSGEISSEELTKILEQLGMCPSAEDIHKMIADVDDDGSGEIGFSEFLTLMQNQGGGKGQDAQKLLETFQKFDIDGDGTLTRLELTTIIGSMAEKLSDLEIEELVDEIDANGDGVIDFEEFIDLMMGDEKMTQL